MKSDEQLALAAADGDHDALTRLLRQYQQRVYNICLRMLSNRDDAAEAAQDVMLNVVKGIARFRSDSKFNTWITRIAMNSSVSLLRKRKLRKTASLDQQSPNQSATFASQLVDSREHSPDANVQKKEMIAILNMALSMISDEYRGILILRDMQGMDYQQISEATDIPVGTVKSRLFRARLALRQQMLKLSPEEKADK